MMDRISWAVVIPLVALALAPVAPPDAATTDDRMLELTAENRADRPCVGMALFTIAQRAHFVTNGRVAEPLDPDLAQVRAWLFPSDGDGPAMVQVGTEELRTVIPRMLEWVRERNVFPLPLDELAGAGCDAPLPAGVE